MLAQTYTAVQEGVEARLITVEASSLKTTPKIQITGLPGEVVKESRERIMACLSHLGFDIPRHRILIHLLPAGFKKQGSQFDMAMALATLKADGCLDGVNLERFGFLGELSLDGRLRAVVGLLSLAETLAATPGIETIFVPADNSKEAALLRGSKIRIVSHLGEVLDHLRGVREVVYHKIEKTAQSASVPWDRTIDDVKGHAMAKRALQVAIAGGHHFLMIGSPGVGKSLLASCTPSLLPRLLDEEIVEVAKIHSLSSTFFATDQRPFRSPHHTVSSAGLLGGGSGYVTPGEVTLAHRGVLFLDELPEFRRDGIEGLREPLETGSIDIHRVGSRFKFPARFTLIAAMNPCPCGLAMQSARSCGCPWERVEQYRKRISGPILDRIDLSVTMAISYSEDPPKKPITHAEAIKGIQSAWNRQQERYRKSSHKTNATASLTPNLEPLIFSEKVLNLVDDYAKRYQLSHRSRVKWLRTSLTVCDIEGAERVEEKHLYEAWGLKCIHLFQKL